MRVRTIDARGLRCPWPALRLARAVREAGGASEVSLLADDPAAPREIAALAAEQGWSLAQQAADGEATLFLVTPFRRQ